MSRKLILSAIVLVFCLTGPSLMAAEKQDATAIEKKIKKTQKCWKRISWVDRTTSLGNGRRAEVWERSELPVCVDFEKVLNRTCESPDKLICNWTLPPGEKQFKKLAWSLIDPKAHWGLIEDMALSGRGEKYRVGQWKIIEPGYKTDLTDGRIKLQIATIDIDYDGRTEQVVLLNQRSCNEAGWKDLYGVIKSDTRLDWRYNDILGSINASYGAEIMLYKGQAYMFGWDSFPGILKIYRGFSVREGSAFGSINICQFKYVKKGKAKN